MSSNVGPAIVSDGVYVSPHQVRISRIRPRPSWRVARIQDHAKASHEQSQSRKHHSIFLSYISNVIP